MAKGKVKPAEEQSVQDDKVRLELETVKGMLARALADYDNLSKRTERERQSLGQIAAVGIIIKLIPVLDGLDLAQEHLKDAGLAISISDFKKVLSEEGLTEIKPKEGEEFNEDEMEAIEVVKGSSDNIVSKVSMLGWKFNDGTVVRHAKVVVTKKEL